MGTRGLVCAFSIICTYLMQIPVMHIIAIENPERKYVGIIVQSHVTIYVVMDG